MRSRKDTATAFTHLLLRRKYVPWRCALVYERLRCEPWKPWGDYPRASQTYIEKKTVLFTDRLIRNEKVTSQTVRV